MCIDWNKDDSVLIFKKYAYFLKFLKIMNKEDAMGGQESILNVEQDVTTNILMESDQVCSATCDNVLTGQVIFVNGKTQDITISQTCTASTAGCVMSTTLDSQIDNILDSISKQEQTFTDSMISLDPRNQLNQTDLKQIVNNKISQIATATCQATSSNLNANQLIYITGTTGNITISQSGDAVANCVMDLMSKITVFNSEAANNDQTNDRDNVFVAFFSSIGGILLIAGVILILVIFLPEILEKGKSVAESAIGSAKDSGDSDVSGAVKGAVKEASKSKGFLSSISKYLPEEATEAAEFVAANPEVLALL